eukprot:1005537-Pyramimonas_sp.AAC.1
MGRVIAAILAFGLGSARMGLPSPLERSTPLVRGLRVCGVTVVARLQAPQGVWCDDSVTPATEETRRLRNPRLANMVNKDSTPCNFTVFSPYLQRNYRMCTVFSPFVHHICRIFHRIGQRQRNFSAHVARACVRDATLRRVAGGALEQCM